MNRSRSFLLSLLCVTMLSGGLDNAYAQEENEGTDANIARLQVKISELEEQIRKLQGNIEQVQYDNKQLKNQLEKTNTDTQYRLGELEKKQQAAPAPAPVTAPQAQNNDDSGPDSGKLQPVQSAPSDADIAAVPKFATPRDLYQFAFGLLNQTKYKESSDAFTAFTKRYPKDPLIGNAWYWLGEIDYVKHDYVRAADDFRQGYESAPSGPKAPDNLLRLAMSLNAVNKNNEACVVLKQVVGKYGNTSSMRQRAEQEMNSIGCNQ